MFAQSWSILHKTVYCVRVEDSSLNITAIFHYSPDSLMNWRFKQQQPRNSSSFPLVKYKSIHSKNYALGAQNRRVHEHTYMHACSHEDPWRLNTRVHTHEDSGWSQWRVPGWFHLHQGTSGDQTYSAGFLHQLPMVKITWQAWNTNTSFSQRTCIKV